MRLRSFAAAVALSVIGVASAPAGTPETLVGVGDAYVSQDESGQSWTIGNGTITYRVGLNALGALVPMGLARPGVGAAWTVESASGLSYQQKDRRVSLGQADVPFRAAWTEEYLGGVRLSLVFDDVMAGLRVTKSYACYPQAPAIETWSTFETTGSTSEIPISDIGIWQLTVPVQEAHWITGHLAGAGDGGPFTKRQQALGQDVPFEVGSSSRSSESAVPTLWFSGPQGNLLVGLLWSGSWTLSATNHTRRGMVTVRLSAGSTATTVREGEPLESPHGVFGVVGTREIDVTAALQQYVTNGLRRGRSINPLVTYNTWFAYGTQLDDETARAEMRSAAGLGVELFVLDAGWSPGAKSASDYTTGLGSWTVDAKRFPAGLGALGDYARSLGMKFGVWVEPERVDTATVNRAGLARERFLAMTGGRYNAGVKNDHADSAQICLGDAEAREWMLGQLVRFIDEARPDYLKWDNNYWINCTRTNHGHGTQDGNFAHVRGLYTVLDALRARYPDLLVENCSGGGNRLDLGMLRHTDAGWMDDVTSPSAVVRHNLEGLGTVFPPRYLLSFVMDDATEPIHEAADMPLYFRSRMAGALGLSVIGAEFGEDDHSGMSREIALYKVMRDAGPEPVLALLTNQATGTANGAWDAVQLSALGTDSNFVLAFRGSSADEHVTIRPVNLGPGVSYQISTPRGRPLARIDGATLMEEGVEVNSSSHTAGHVIVFTPIR
jgi:alpha-galactosidase